MQYVTIFDVTQAGFRQWSFSAFGLIGIAAGVVMLMLARARVFQTRSPSMQKWFPPVWLGMAVLWTLIASVTTFSDYRKAVDAMRNNRPHVVEGVVNHFVPMPYGGHAMESFDVQGVTFEYSDYVITAGFNNTSSHGGPIHEGLPVKIWYVNGEILRLDIKKP